MLLVGFIIRIVPMHVTMCNAYLVKIRVGRLSLDCIGQLIRRSLTKARGVRIFYKSKSYLKIMGASRIT